MRQLTSRRRAPTRRSPLKLSATHLSRRSSERRRFPLLALGSILCLAPQVFAPLPCAQSLVARASHSQCCLCCSQPPAPTTHQQASTFSAQRKITRSPPKTNGSP